ncbi:MAG: hypothetical protein JWR72_241 [Flavisolibacter sp.]|jgi:hypothetical protein|nr:hypothetical protein [Flavisolibacter sp.]
MAADKKHFEEVAAFIKEHRSNEAAFEKLYTRLVEETEAQASDAAYKTDLLQVKQKAAEEYNKAKETGGTAWPEFEKFVTGFEKAVIQAMHS